MRYRSGLLVCPSICALALVPLLAATMAGLGLWCWAGPASAGQQWVPPVAAPLIVERPLELPADLIHRPWQSAHRGVDLAAAVGDAVWAAGDGIVVFAGPLAGRGVVSVEHVGGLRTTYEPVDEVVTAGEQVSAGDLVGRVAAGGTHCPTTCVHWALKRSDQYLDPLALLGSNSVELLPHLRHARELGLSGTDGPATRRATDESEEAGERHRSAPLAPSTSQAAAGRAARPADSADPDTAVAGSAPSPGLASIALPVAASAAAVTAAWRVHRSRVEPR